MNQQTLETKLKDIAGHLKELNEVATDHSIRSYKNIKFYYLSLFNKYTNRLKAIKE